MNCSVSLPAIGGQWCIKMQFSINPDISSHYGKFVRTIFQCTIILQLRWEVPKNLNNSVPCGTKFQCYLGASPRNRVYAKFSKLHFKVLLSSKNAGRLTLIYTEPGSRRATYLYSVKHFIIIRIFRISRIWTLRCFTFTKCNTTFFLFLISYNKIPISIHLIVSVHISF